MSVWMYSTRWPRCGLPFAYGSALVTRILSLTVILPVSWAPGVGLQEPPEGALQQRPLVGAALHVAIGVGEVRQRAEELPAPEPLRRLVLHPEPIRLLAADLLVRHVRQHQRLPRVEGRDAPLSRGLPPALPLDDQAPHGRRERSQQHEGARAVGE